MHPVLFQVSSANVCAFFFALVCAIAAGWCWSRLTRVSFGGVPAAVVGALIGGAVAHAWESSRGAHLMPVYAYGLMLAASLIAGWLLVTWLGMRHERLAPERIAAASLVTALFAIIGARVLFLVTNPQLFASPGQWFAVGDGGMVAYGGFLGGLLGGWLYWRRGNLSVLRWGDLVAPTLGLGLGLTRIGCYLFGCDFGMPLGPGAPKWLEHLGTFPRGSPAFREHVSRYGLPPTAMTSLPVHPTQLYESAVGMMLLGVTLLVWRRRRYPGEVLLVFTGLYAAWRFFIELVRDDPQRGFYFGLSTSQIISLALLAIALGLWMRQRLRNADLLSPAWAYNAVAAEQSRRQRVRRRHATRLS